MEETKNLYILKSETKCNNNYTIELKPHLIYVAF
jgi:hypothetical protein